VHLGVLHEALKPGYRANGLEGQHNLEFTSLMA
jgi:hypothetical protein